MTILDNQGVLREKNQYVILQSLDRATLRHRLPGGLVLIYYVWILFSAWFMSGLWSWNIGSGVTWTSGGPGMFFPIPMGPGMLTVITTANIIDQIFYLIFMHNGIWILWILLGSLYIFSPYRLNVGVVKRRFGRKS
ncbi:MAG: hypothetical protein ACTSWA_03015 [Candidatus Thorarchaeota archaeon]